MLAYNTLISADAYRDGGSLEARFIRHDGGSETIWLQARPDSPQMRKFVHTDLSIYEDAERNGPARKIRKSSHEEVEVLTALRDFLDHPKIDVPFADQSPSEEFLQIVEALIYRIPLRIQNEERA